MSRRVNRLFDLEFDEVSSVDRPANQHGLIAFSKSLATQDPQEDTMTAIFTEAGVPVADDELEHGDTVYDEAGNEYVFLADGAEDVEDTEGEDGDGVEKTIAVGGAGVAERVARDVVATGKKGNAWKRSRGYQFAQGFQGRTAPGASTANRFGAHVGANKGKYAAGTAGVGVAGGGAYMIGRDGETSKSLGDSVLERLSKAVTEADRDEVVVKMAGEVEIAKAQAQAAQDALDTERDIRITQEFISKAAEYNLPVDPADFGPILKAMVEVLDEDQIDLLDRVFTVAGDALYDEIGHAGGASNSVLDEVNAYAGELVGKSAGDFSQEQAMVAMFSANPGAYDAYLAEQNGR